MQKKMLKKLRKDSIFEKFHTSVYKLKIEISYFFGAGKGQIISECPYEIIVWTKIPTKKFPRFLP